MQHSITQSVQQTSPNSCTIGASIKCEWAEQLQEGRILASWTDGRDRFALKQASQPLSASITEPSDKIQLIHTGGSSSAVWKIGNEVVCKVKIRQPGMESEARTINFVKETFPQVPVPDVVYEWFEEDKSFLLVKRVHGSTLRDAWTSFSDIERNFVLHQVANFCEAFALQTSTKLCSISGKALLERFLATSKSGLIGPLTQQECMSYFLSSSNGPAPPIGMLHFNHPDLGPGNIMVSKNGVITGILDWEAAGFYPRFWVATKPSVAPGLDFCPPILGFDDHEWRKRLRIELEARGFPPAAAWYMDWRKRNKGK